MKSNLRELAQQRLSEEGKGCRCIRCREVGQNDISLDDPSMMIMKDTEYGSSGGTEHFISLEYDDMIVGYVRLRIDDTASVRELKVFGRMAGIGEHGDDWQHRGFGKQLMAKAEEIAKKEEKRTMRITAGVGVREYYRSLGYELQAPYMVKDLGTQSL
jgi:elongator complex protein 3